MELTLEHGLTATAVVAIAERVDAQEESMRSTADRLGNDNVRDIRPAVVVDAAGVLTAALHVWARGGRGHDSDAADLAARVKQATTL
ncbi:hypothetical protein [Streptomyces sp. Act143]|uniref:hypothetical protein n=1 Tax=Streptomyces sp. Act143 TaxID=2200760 RepID=UPI0026BA18EE